MEQKEYNESPFSELYVNARIWGIFPAKHYLEKDEVILSGWFYKYFQWVFDFVSMLFSIMLEFQNKEQVFIVKYSKEAVNMIFSYKYMMDNEEVLTNIKKLIEKHNDKIKYEKSSKEKSS